MQMPVPTMATQQVAPSGMMPIHQQPGQAFYQQQMMMPMMPYQGQQAQMPWMQAMGGVQSGMPGMVPPNAMSPQAWMGMPGQGAAYPAPMMPQQTGGGALPMSQPYGSMPGHSWNEQNAWRYGMSAGLQHQHRNGTQSNPPASQAGNQEGHPQQQQQQQSGGGMFSALGQLPRRRDPRA